MRLFQNQMACTKSNGPNDPSAHLGFEAPAPRDSAIQKGEAILRSLSAARDNLWLAADSRSEAEIARNQDFRTPAAVIPLLLSRQM